MALFSKSLALVVGASALGLGVASQMTAATAGDGSGLRCEIYQSRQGGSTVLEGVVFGPASAGGSYKFSVSKSGGGGSSDINQSGDFTVSSNGKSTVGSVSLGGGGGYSATLKVSAGGHSTSCKEHVGGSL